MSTNQIVDSTGTTRPVYRPAYLAAPEPRWTPLMTTLDSSLSQAGRVCAGPVWASSGGGR